MIAPAGKSTKSLSSTKGRYWRGNILKIIPIDARSIAELSIHINA
jgi:hypothetical protein